MDYNKPRLCIDCEYCNFNHASPERSTCGAPENYSEMLVSLVTGARLPLSEDCDTARVSGDACGRDAKWFLPRVGYHIAGVSLYQMHNDPAIGTRKVQQVQRAEKPPTLEDF